MEELDQNTPQKPVCDTIRLILNTESLLFTKQAQLYVSFCLIEVYLTDWVCTKYQGEAAVKFRIEGHQINPK